MTPQSDESLLGIGLYTIPEAARLTGVPSRSIRRWLLGYRYKPDGEYRERPSVWSADAPHTDETVGLSFLDLIEVRFVQAFREHGVTWKIIREAAARACEEFHKSHAFVSRRFRTDGRWIILETIERAGGQKRLINLVRSQYEFEKIISPILKGGLVFSEADLAIRWFPAWPKRQVVIDPHRCFGRPIVASGGVPTEILAGAVKVEGSPNAVAKWYDVPLVAVHAAVDFENRLGG